MGVHNRRDVSATPTVDGNAVVLSRLGRQSFAVEKESGRLIWSHKISDYDGVEGAISRVSPAVDGNQVIIGTLRVPIRFTKVRT